MTAIRRALVLLALFIGGCVSSTTMETRQVEATGGLVDARRRAEAHAALAGEYYQRGNFAVALNETRQAINDDPKYVPAYNMQALIFMQLREDASARQAFEKALSLEPANSEVLNNYGWFLCLQNDPRALPMMMRAANDTRYATPEKAFLSAGLCMRRQARNTEAEDYLRRAVSIRPDLVGALFNLAAITYERGSIKEAENYMSRYTRLAPPTLDSLVLGVKIARATNDRSTEESNLQQLRRLFPEAPQTRELLEGKK